MHTIVQNKYGRSHKMISDAGASKSKYIGVDYYLCLKSRNSERSITGNNYCLETFIRNEDRANWEEDKSKWILFGMA